METAYEVWLSLSVDHVIPTGSGKRVGFRNAVSLRGFSNSSTRSERFGLSADRGFRLFERRVVASAIRASNNRYAMV
jgi:hypothetical protein